jgi:hypothetical protein
MVFRVLVMVVLVVACGSFGVPAATAASSGPVTPVMGANLLSAAQLAGWYERHHGTNQPQIPALHNSVAALAQVFLDEGQTEGVRGDIAFVQSMLETGWLSFQHSQIPPDADNYAGLYAFDGRTSLPNCTHGDTAPSRCMASPQHGVLMQIQLLRSYADPSTEAMTGRLISAPADRVGAAPLWDSFGGNNCPCGKLIWASANNYGPLIVQMYQQALAENGLADTSFTCRIRSRANGNYVSTELGDTGILQNVLRARSGTVGPWERYLCLEVGTNRWAIMSLANDKYVSTELGYPGVLQGTLRARSSRVGAWETYILVPGPSCLCYTLQGANSEYTSVELRYPGSTYGLLRARAATPQSWEQFEITSE